MRTQRIQSRPLPPPRRRGYSQWVRWREIARAAWILGRFKPGNVNGPQRVLRERIADRAVIKHKPRRAQGAPAWYAVKLGAVVCCLMFGAQHARADFDADFEKLWAARVSNIKSGTAIEGSISGWHHSLDLKIEDNSQRFAEMVGELNCHAPKLAGLSRQWSVRVYLVSGTLAKECVIDASGVKPEGLR